MNNNKYFHVSNMFIMLFFKNWSNYYDFIHKAKSPHIYLPIYFISILEIFKNLLKAGFFYPNKKFSHNSYLKNFSLNLHFKFLSAFNLKFSLKFICFEKEFSYFV